MNRGALILLAGAAAIYAAVWLPPYFSLMALASSYGLVVVMAGLTATTVVWRLGSFDRGVASGLALVAGLVSLFWPAIELLFQGVDGGSMLPYSNAVFLASVSLSACASAAGVLTMTRPALAFRLLAIAAIGTVIVGAAAPSSPPSARQELTLGLPLLIIAAAASWLAKRQAT